MNHGRSYDTTSSAFLYNGASSSYTFETYRQTEQSKTDFFERRSSTGLHKTIDGAMVSNGFFIQSNIILINQNNSKKSLLKSPHLHGN